MKSVRSFKSHGFTLVELLVVIAIIGILAAVVMPAINSALLRGRALSISANGRSLYQMLVQKQTEETYTTVSTFWPCTATEPTTVPDEDSIFATSTEYFKAMVTNGTMNVAYSFFAAPGVPSATDATTFESKNNAWLITSGGENLVETAPLFMTKNIGTGTELSTLLKFDANGKFQGTGVPFIDKAFVFTTRGGASYALIKDDLKKERFDNLFITTDGENDLENQILQP